MNIRTLKRPAKIASVLMLLAITSFSSLAAGENEDFRFADRLYGDGMYVAAAEEYLRFAEKYPTSRFRPPALFNAGQAWMKAGKAMAALDALETLLASYPQDENAPRARFYRGNIFQALRQFREAAREYLMIPELYPDHPLGGQARLNAGEALIAAGDSQEGSGVLRRLINGKRHPDLTARAMYSLALALVNLDRDLEADAVLEELVNDYRSSPVAALALFKLGDREELKGNLEKAENYFRRAARDYREESFREKAVARVLDMCSAGEKHKSVLQDAGVFLSEFPASERRPGIYRMAIQAAWKLNENDRALELISAWEGEGTARDSTGEMSLVRAKIYSRKNQPRKALQALKEFRYSWPRSLLLREALLLQAQLIRQTGTAREAAEYYHLVLMETGVEEDRIPILQELASLYFVNLNDTLTGIHYWERIVEEAEGSDAAEEALWMAADAREKIGHRAAAARLFGILKKSYPGGRFAEQVDQRLEALARTAGPGAGAVSDLARSAVSEGTTAEKYLSVGIILQDRARLPREAVEYLERARRMELSDSAAAQAGYYLARAHYDIFEQSRISGRADQGARKRALSLWLKLARESAGTYWGGKGHRDYLEYKLPEWKLSEQLNKLDEYLSYYKEGENRYWAWGRKVDLLYAAAGRGEGWAADSALVISGEILRGDPPGDIRRETVLKSGYLKKMTGDLEGAAGAWSDFVSVYPDDPRAMLVYYDLGEVYLAAQEYDRALGAYRSCLRAQPRQSLAHKCLLRQGDCHYYNRDFERAADLYHQLGTGYPESALADEAAYREALALERLGRYQLSDSILEVLTGKEEISGALRSRLVGRWGQRLAARGRYAEAEPFLGELVSAERTPLTLALYAEVLLETGQDKKAIDNFTQALKLAGADSCRTLSGRSRARFLRGEFQAAARDLENVLVRCPAYPGAARALIEKGRAEIQAGQIEKAMETFSSIRDNFEAGGEREEALYSMALCDLQRGGYQEATDKLNLLVRESPQWDKIDQVYFKLAMAQYGSGQLNLAAASYALAGEAARDAESAYLAGKNEAVVCQELERWDRAAAAWQRLAERFPQREDMVEILFNLGFCYSQEGRFGLAWEVYRRIPAIAQTEEQQGRAYYWSGISLKNQGKCAEAVRDFLRVPYLRTGGMWGITATLEAAVCYEKIGQVEEARNIYQSVVSRHGATSDWGKIAKQALDRIDGVETGGEGEKSGEENTGSSSRKGG
ncbi:MAG: tetratricopeptide repeat protein [Candidatus Krumholzibacteriota bacterium]|nr:tetratricopeptide repeat protein [Candidatus Krumholzibacteriota bacterium]